MLLIIGLIIYTFITMLGGNPLHDRFGFSFWQNPGAFAEYYTTGDTGRFMGMLSHQLAFSELWLTIFQDSFNAWCPLLSQLLDPNMVSYMRNFVRKYH